MRNLKGYNIPFALILSHLILFSLVGCSAIFPLKPDYQSIKSMGEVLQDFDDSNLKLAFVYGNSDNAGALRKDPDENRYLRFRYNLKNRSVYQPHAGYLMDINVKPVSLNSSLIFLYRNNYIDDVRLHLNLSNQALTWFLKLEPSNEWKIVRLPLKEKFTRSLEGATTKSLRLTTFAPLIKGAGPVYLDLDEFRIETLESLPEEREKAELLMRGDDVSLAQIEEYIRIKNLRSLKETYSVNEPILISFELTNTSSKMILVPKNTQFSAPYYLIGTIQRWLVPLDESAKSTDFKKASKVNGRVAAGGEIQPFEHDYIEPHEALPLLKTIYTPHNPGRYQVVVEIKNPLTSKVFDTASIEIIVAENERQGAAPLLVMARTPKEEWQDLQKQIEEHYKNRECVLAEEVAEKALKLAEENFGSNSVEIARSLFNLGAMKEIQKKDAEAEKLYERARAIRKKHGLSTNPLGLHTEVWFDLHPKGRKDPYSYCK